MTYKRRWGSSAALLVVCLLLPSLAAAHSHRHLLRNGVRQPSHRACGVAVKDEAAHNKAMAAAEIKVYGHRQRAFNSSDQMRAAVLASPFPAQLTLKVQFHVVHWKGYSSVEDTASPPVGNAALAKQLAVLNRDFKAARLRFVAKGAPMFHESKAWASACFDRLPEIYAAVAKDTATTVNVILCDLASTNGILGLTPEMPSESNQGSKTQVVAIDFRTMPGGPYNRYSHGRTLTHELGHFFGLLHTFGSCDEDADGVADTPAELEAASGCPARRDTCPGHEGEDPVWSFMDYSDDLCMSRFSPGQVARMQAVLLEYRPLMVAAGSPKKSRATAIKLNKSG